MHTILANKAGFCSGVKRAVDMARDCFTDDRKWYTLGPLVHNQAVIDYLHAYGIDSVDSLGDIKDIPAGIIIRSHGVTPSVISDADTLGLIVKDATCPLVKQVHEIVASLSEKYDIVVFGDRDHPEVQALIGWCDEQAIVVNDPDQICDLQISAKMAVVSQTTKDEKKFERVVDALKSKCPELRVFNTICPATRLRQKAARDLCSQVDVMLVIGDSKSSNTATLYKECLDTGVNTYQIQSSGDIDIKWFRDAAKVGITAGASTPDWIIKEVVERMTEMENNQAETGKQAEAENVVQDPVQENIEGQQEESFAKMEAEMADFATPSKGDILTGRVIQVLDDEVMVDVGGKSEGIIPQREMSLKDIDSCKDLVKVGDEIEVLVLKWDDDGTILLSKKKVDSQKVLDSLEEYYKEGKTIDGTVTDSVKGGLLVDVGIVAFLPASHVEDGYARNLEEYIGRVLNFKIIEFNRNKRRGSQVVLSRKDLVAEEKNKLKKSFWENIEEGQTRTGKIKRLVDYGAFIDLGGYEGLLHVSEMDHRRIDHPSDIMNEGDEVEVYILGLDREKERVSLSRKKLLKSPWQNFVEKYNEGDVIEGTVVRTAPFGAFVELDPGVDGLVHISQLANRRIEKPEDVVSINEKVMVKILSIDPDEKRVGLSIRALIEDQEKEEVEEYLDQQEGE
ncbi:MAG: bifunctional 4-hydroxy-3-methylbut-2-enyl diphosphate reductase/30S ribosomal protein S1 [Syntrophomonadaceae bacterium]|nr:bifunctional 4-hydroxy-3-methylbut-2-enyl diphosphate reductase/30S ribosomal protein S1 [Syntrophomonadaceae bacterium]